MILEAIIDHVRKDIPDGGLPPWMLGNQGVLPLPQAS